MKLQITQWNADAVVAKADAALARVGQQWGPEATRQISTAQFTWPNATRRKNGTLIKKNQLRNIVDTGAPTYVYETDV